MATAADRLANNLNFGALGKATELRQRLLFTLGALIVFRLGTFLPIPGINPLALQQFFEQMQVVVAGCPLRGLNLPGETICAAQLQECLPTAGMYGCQGGL